MFASFKLGTKFNLLLVVAIAIGIALSGSVLFVILGRNAADRIEQNALLLLQTIESVRDYTNAQVRPELTPRLETEPTLISKASPQYSAREVFEILRKNPKYSNFFYKEAVLNPTNLRDKADPFEIGVIEQFRQNPSLKETSGFRSFPEENLFYIARQSTVPEESCLRCHGKPDEAPKSLIASYGDKNGFGWKLHDIVGAQILSVPAREITNAAVRSFTIVLAAILVGFAIATFLVNLLLQRTVIQPLRQMAETAYDVSTGKLDRDFQHTARDEIGKLADAFNRMKTSLTIAMNMIDKSQ